MFSLEQFISYGEKKASGFLSVKYIHDIFCCFSCNPILYVVFSAFKWAFLIIYFSFLHYLATTEEISQ